jgi:hypothetical protein
MTSMLFLGTALVAALSAAGLVETFVTRERRATAASSAGPSKSANVKPPEDIVRIWVPEAGYIRGTREAVAAWGTPLKADPRPNRTVEACRVMAWGEAEKLGARSVEAVSAGPHHRNPKGEWVAPVRMRVIYPRFDGIEVKVATMTCIMDRENKIVNAFT